MVGMPEIVLFLYLELVLLSLHGLEAASVLSSIEAEADPCSGLVVVAVVEVVVDGLGAEAVQQCLYLIWSTIRGKQSKTRLSGLLSTM